jgi:hypothetical protein
MVCIDRGGQRLDALALEQPHQRPAVVDQACVAARMAKSFTRMREITVQLGIAKR